MKKLFSTHFAIKSRLWTNRRTNALCPSAWVRWIFIARFVFATIEHSWDEELTQAVLSHVRVTPVTVVPDKPDNAALTKEIIQNL